MEYLYFYSKKDLFNAKNSRFSSPMGYLYFYSEDDVYDWDKEELVLVPYGVSIFLFCEYYKVCDISTLFSSPMGYLYFYSDGTQLPYFKMVVGSRPLWGIYISIQAFKKWLAKNMVSSRPLWGIYISIHL